jgi:16S rRNA (cytosine967-C5)-methyltransferase
VGLFLVHTRGWASSLSVSPARRVAFDLLLELRRKPELHSDVLLRSRQVEALSALDKNLATTLVMGVLRWHLVLQRRIAGALSKPKNRLADPVQASLELGALQLLLLDRIPTHAAIFESVELVRQSGNAYAVGLVNAVLRKLAQAHKLDAAEASAAHPSWMVERWVAAYGLETAEAVCGYDQLPPPTTIRLPSAAAKVEGLQLEAGAFVTRARRVVAGEVNGTVRIQDEGSQLIAELAGRGSEILDCCAAPGGKTAILAERNPGASITASDVSPVRLKAMQRNLQGAGIRFRVLDATELPFQRQFDLVLCDAPCSGTGTIARNPEIRYRITVDDFRRQHERQVRILTSAMRAVRDGGRVVYSTCSLEGEENEAVVREALERVEGFRLVPWGEQIRTLEREGTLHLGTAARLFPGSSPGHFLRTFPGLYPGDGFFAACIARGTPPATKYIPTGA